MSFEQLYGSFYGKDSESISILKKEYDSLKEKAQSFDKIANKMKQLTQENKKLSEELESLKSKESKQEKESDLVKKTELYLNSLKRLKADFENYRKSVERTQERSRLKFTFDIMKKLINHFDDLKRASEVLDTLETNESVKKGFNMIVKNFESLLQEYGVKSMDCEGNKFNPYENEVLMVENNPNFPNGTILQELEKGYYFNQEVLRPAKVKISQNESYQG